MRNLKTLRPEPELRGEGFYKQDKDSLLYAPYAVYAKDYELVRASRNRYTYPKHGWYWFDNETKAKEFFENIE